MTSNVLVFTEQLLDYVDTIAGVLAQDSVYSNAFSLIPNNAKIDKNKALLGVYISKYYVIIIVKYKALFIIYILYISFTHKNFEIL